ncbi:MAG: glycosyltransferase family 4 protein [Candidatus Omnitrophica bacterium]|nr:glycosyltransferase family 4 protein [Candidatus Omnitrophota bacterium]
MKILLLANHFNTGGITTYMLTLSKEYIRRGHQVFMATSGGDALSEAEFMGVNHRTLPALKCKCEFHPALLPAAFSVAALIKEHGIDVIHSQTRVTQSVAAIASMISAKPYVSTCHGFFKPRLSRKLLPLWGRTAIAVSQSVVTHLKKDLMLGEQFIRLIPNGIDTKKFRPFNESERLALRDQYSLGSGAVVGIIARLSDVKGHCHLIDAMNELLHRMPGVKCLIFGEGPLDLDLKTKVRQLGLDKSIQFHRVNGRPEKLLPMFDVFVLPSIQEGLGLSVMEAQACGVPVVASRIGGLVEAVFDGRTGILVPVGDHVAIADAILKILADKDLAARFSKDGRDFIRAKFAVDDMADATLDVYRKAMVHA